MTAWGWWVAERFEAILRNPQQARQALDWLYEQAKPWLVAGHELAASIGQKKQERSHVNHYHSLIGQISKQVGGDLADKDDAKRILISAFRLDTKDDPDLRDQWAAVGDMRMGRGLRGEVVLLGAQSRDFKAKLARAFIHWLYAFGAEAGVTFKPWPSDGVELRDSRQWEINPETGEIT